MNRRRDANICPCLIWVLVGLLLAGCQPAPHVDLDAEALRLSGIDRAFSYRESENAAPTPGELTATQAVRLALIHDPRIAQAVDRVREAEADDDQARLLPNPILNIDIRLPEAGVGKTAIEIIPTEDLIAILQKPQQVSAADSRLREAVSNAMTSVLDLIQQVQEAYDSAQSIDAEIGAAQLRVDEIAKLRDVSKHRLAAGEAAESDVLALDIQRVQADADLDDLRLQRTQARITLARLVGQARGLADWQLLAPPVPTPTDASEGAWLDAALANRPEILAHVWELRALGAEVEISNLAPLEGDSFGVYAVRDPTWEVGPTITIPIPIFDTGAAARAKARAQRDEAKHALEQQSLDVIEEVRDDYAAYRAAKSALDVTENQLLPMQERFERQSALSYQNGDVDLNALLLARTDLQQTRSKVVELREKLVVAMLQLQRAVGGAAVAGAVERQPTMKGTAP